MSKTDPTPDLVCVIPDLKGRTIAVAEDDPYSFTILYHLLSKTGADIQHLKDGKELMHYLEYDTPDLILLDLSMPEMSGFDCLYAIRAKGIHTKIVVQTAYTLQEQQKKVLQAGADDCLAKPIRKTVLYPMVEALLQDK